MPLIRSAQASDFSHIARIFHAAIHETARSHYTEEQLEAWSPEARSPDHWHRRTSKLTVLVALQDDGVAGFVGLSTSGHIDLLFVRPDLVRQGIGRALLSEAERLLVAGGAPTAWADVSLAAQPFFLAMGYRVVREQTVFCRCVELRNFRMQKTLTAVA
jgi:putative acetyltransferase